MINIIDLHENDYERMEGEFFCECFDKKMDIDYDKDMSLEDVDKAIKRFYDVYSKLLTTLCKHTTSYCKDTMEICPDVDYKKDLYNLNNDLQILNYIGFTRLKLELYKNDVAFNLMGWCDWAEEKDLQWIIYSGKIVYVGPWYDFDIDSPGLNSAICNYCSR